MPIKDDKAKQKDKIVVEEIPEQPEAESEPEKETVYEKEDVKQTDVEESGKEEVSVKFDLAEKESAKEVSTPTEPKLTSFSQLDSEKQKSRSIVEPPENEAEIKESEAKPEDEEDASSVDVKKWLADIRPDTTKENEKSGKSFGKIFFIILIVLIVGALVAGGAYYYKNGMSKVSLPGSKSNEDTDVPTPEVTSTPSPSEVDLTTLNVQILNGSGIPGEAGKVKTLLNDLKFKKVDTANADKYDYTTTLVSLKKNLSDSVYEKIKGALSKNYILEKSEETLPEDSEYDIQITVGSKKAN